MSNVTNDPSGLQTLLAIMRDEDTSGRLPASLQNAWDNLDLSIVPAAFGGDATHDVIPERYRVEWVIDSDAENPEAAAREAWEAMRRPDSIANAFIVRDRNGTATLVDLEDSAPNRGEPA